MGSGRRKGGIKKNQSTPSTKSLNQGKGQEITGVTLPEEGGIKGWAFGNKQSIACAQVDGRLYGIQGDCPRCAFDLYRGTVITDEKAFGPDVPRVACSTCSTTFSFRTGKHGPAIKKKGFWSDFVSDLAKTATAQDAMKDARAFIVTKDGNERVFLRERILPKTS